MQEKIKSKPKSLVSNSIWSMSLTVWQILVTFLLTPFLVKELGVESYGLLILFITITAFLSNMNFGMGDTTLRYVAFYFSKNDFRSINRIVSNTFFCYIIIGIIILFILLFSSDTMVSILFSNSNIPFDDLKSFFQIMSCTIASFFIGSAFSSVPQALGRFDISTKINIINNVLYVFGTLYILFNNGSLKELLYWNLINTIVLQLLFIFSAKNLIRNIKLSPSFDLLTFKEIYSFSSFTFISQLFSFIQNHSDKFIVSSLLGTSAISFLTVPQQISYKLSQLINSIGKVLVPTYSNVNNKTNFKNIFKTSIWYLFVLSNIIFMPLIILMYDFLSIWINDEFAQKSYYIAQLICISFLLKGVFNTCAAYYNGIGQAKYLTFSIVLMGMITLILNYFLITKFNEAGLGYSYIVSSLIAIFIILITWKKLLKGSFSELLSPLFIPIIISIAIYFMLKNFDTFFRATTWIELLFSFIIIDIVVILSFFIIDYILDGKSNKFNSILNKLKKRSTN